MIIILLLLHVVTVLGPATMVGQFTRPAVHPPKPGKKTQVFAACAAQKDTLVTQAL